MKLKIDGKEIKAEEGQTIYETALKAGINIPVMCYHPDAGHFASCMVCVVKDQPTGKILPACSVKVEEGMDIVTGDVEILEARKMALELLLSEHVGDCEAPCQISCPAHMDIPLMNRLLADGKTDEALKVVRKDIVLPSVLGRICPAPCEGACRRKSIDESVSICLLKRYAGDIGAIPIEKQAATGKKVAVIGAGPAGLAAAYYLQIKGIQAEVFDQNEKPGGALMYAVPDERLNKKILEKEIELIRKSGVLFAMNTTISLQSFKKITENYNAVVVATGDLSANVTEWGMQYNEKQIISDRKTHQTSYPHVFAVGNVCRSARLAVRSVGQGKEAAFSIEQFLTEQPVKGEPRMFNSRFGKLVMEEYAEYLKESVNYGATKKNRAESLTAEEVIREAKRCMHCDCRKPDNCKLRIYSALYQANQKRFDYTARKNVRKIFNHEILVYEPEKCIKCGICVRLTEKQKEKFGFTFIGRGFDVEIGIPFNEELNEGITKTAQQVAEACPTGAIARKNHEI